MSLSGHYPMLIAEAERLASNLLQKGGGEFDKSLVAHVHRFVAKNPEPQKLDGFLDALPKSRLGLYTGRTRPQLEALCRETKRLALTLRREIPQAPNLALAYVLGWTRRLVTARRSPQGR